MITFNEGLKGQPEAIRAWFYPGGNWGEEFVYPKARAVELAKVTKTPVPALGRSRHGSREARGTGRRRGSAASAIMAVQPTGEEVEVAQVVQTAPPPAGCGDSCRWPARSRESFPPPRAIASDRAVRTAGAGRRLYVRSMRNRVSSCIRCLARQIPARPRAQNGATQMNGSS